MLTVFCIDIRITSVTNTLYRFINFTNSSTENLESQATRCRVHSELPTMKMCILQICWSPEINSPADYISVMILDCIGHGGWRKNMALIPDIHISIHDVVQSDDYIGPD